ncbi:MAG: Fic family protein [Streptococcaceae bacterium]|jgi:Fic family protein|nr:Fic family protein [Streptococcaceae bacterium]
MKPPFSITNKMLNLIVEITQKVTRLELEQERNLHLRKENRIRSIQSSLAIEKNSLSVEQVTDIINGKRVFGAPKEIREVQNAYEAYELVFKMNPYSIDDFLKAHGLMTKELVKESGQFRGKDVGVYDSDGTLVHLGARPQFVYHLMKELFDWAKQDDIPDLIKSCVVHFEIEMTHPFPDGNGRMGRLWQNLILSKWQRVFEWIPIETIVYEHQAKYYDMLMVGDKENDSTQFIEFMLEVILETILEFDNIKGQADISKILNDKVLDKMSDKEQQFFIQIYPFLAEVGEIKNGKASEITGRASGTVRRYLVKMTELGIFKVMGANKNRRYVLNEKIVDKISDKS